jgi:hypothetical protein
MTRVVGYEFSFPVDLEGATDELLEREVAREGTPVTQYGTDGYMLWLNGRPGPGLRRVVADVAALGWARVSRRSP